jgi:hypothetical protein
MADERGFQVPAAIRMRVPLLTALLVLTFAPLTAASTISTLGSWNGTAGISTMGEPNSATYGQTFVAPSVDSVMTSFTFYLNDFADPNLGVVDFAAYVAAWDGSKASGPMLYSSGALATNNNGGADGMQAFTINTGGINLIGGNQYVAFFSASNFFDGVSGSATMGFLANADPYTGGSFVFAENGADFGLLTAQSWLIVDDGDAAFEMSFSAADNAPVPEPASLMLLGSGLIAAAVRRYRRT